MMGILMATIIPQNDNIYVGMTHDFF